MPEYPAAARAAPRRGLRRRRVHRERGRQRRVAARAGGPAERRVRRRGARGRRALALSRGTRPRAAHAEGASRLQARVRRTRRAQAAARDALGPRNQCVRENAIYNYGESVDVGLINACSDPLMVFGCAEGTGRYAGRWICSDSEQQGNVLVTQTDRRLGSRFAAGTEERRPHVHLHRRLLGDARAELAILVGRVRGNRRGLSRGCAAMGSRRRGPTVERRSPGSQPRRARALELARSSRRPAAGRLGARQSAARCPGSAFSRRRPPARAGSSARCALHARRSFPVAGGSESSTCSVDALRGGRYRRRGWARARRANPEPREQHREDREPERAEKTRRDDPLRARGSQRPVRVRTATVFLRSHVAFLGERELGLGDAARRVRVR